MKVIAPRVTEYVSSKSRLICREIKNRRETALCIWQRGDAREAGSVSLSMRAKGERKGTCEWNFLLVKKKMGIKVISPQNVLLEHSPAHSSWSLWVRLCV